jgi:tRNA(fMet)-specific endonuclease VapC
MQRHACGSLRAPSVRSLTVSLDPAKRWLPLSVVAAELRYRAEKSRRKRLNHRLLDTRTQVVRRVDVGANAATTHGEVRTALEKMGKPLGVNDMLVAANASSLGLILITDNEREFKQVRSLAMENWRRT